MPHRPTHSLLPPEIGTAPVRLRTLVNLRWLAALGQTVAIAVAATVLGFDLPLLGCAALVGLLVVANLAAQLLYPATYRLSEREAVAVLVFDAAQLAGLLFLTGGLHNPFALLVVGPVTLAATTLSFRATVLVGTLALIAVSLLGGYHMPLVSTAEGPLRLSALHLLGFWTSIVLATVLLGAFAYRMTLETERASRALLATQTALAREQKLDDLGGLVAAAAHELGTPLATIKLVSTELVEELSDNEELRADVALIRSQADRCRDILRAMGRAGSDDPQLRAAPLETVASEAAEPHARRGAAILYDMAAEPGWTGPRPRVRRAPELIHGLRNLVQNAVDFAASTVWIEGRWDSETVRLRIEDDGPGYPPEMIARLGEAFLRSRRRDRPGYDGMGLGLFIAKTLLERTGAQLSFANRRAAGGRRGAVVEVTWPRARIEQDLRNTDAPGATPGDGRTGGREDATGDGPDGADPRGAPVPAAG